MATAWDYRSTCLSFKTFGLLEPSVGYDHRVLQASALSSGDLSVTTEGVKGIYCPTWFWD